MFIKGSVFKLILGSLFILGLSAAAAGVIYKAVSKPDAPTLENIKIDTNAGSCEPVLYFHDNSLNEDEFRVYRRDPGAGKQFNRLQVLAASPGKGAEFTKTDSPLPPGTYTYQVTAYNKFGESGSALLPIVVSKSGLPMCDPKNYIDPTKLPLNPIIVSLSILNDCNVHIAYNDNATNEQGFRIYRDEPFGDPTFVLVTTLGPHTGIAGTYNDTTKLTAGIYGYRMVAFNQYGDSASNYPTIEVTSVCNPVMQILPTKQALVLPTLQKQSSPICNWVAATNVYLRKGPDVAVFDRLVLVTAGQGFPIIGQSEDGQFWVLDVSPGVVGYITKSKNFSLTNGDCSIVSKLKDPAPPVSAATPTKQPGGNNNIASTPCPVGAVCP